MAVQEQQLSQKKKALQYLEVSSLEGIVCFLTSLPSKLFPDLSSLRERICREILGGACSLYHMSVCNVFMAARFGSYFRLQGDKALTWTLWREGTSSENAVSAIGPKKDHIFPPHSWQIVDWYFLKNLQEWEHCRFYRQPLWVLP